MEKFTVCKKIGEIMLNSKFEKHFIDSCQEMQEVIHNNTVEKGVWENSSKEFDGVKIALMHSELSEALEIMREGDKNQRKFLKFHILKRNLLTLC